MADGSNEQGEFAKQPQSPPGVTNNMEPVPDHGEESYVGSGKLAGKVALTPAGPRGLFYQAVQQQR